MVSMKVGATDCCSIDLDNDVRAIEDCRKWYIDDRHVVCLPKLGHCTHSFHLEIEEEERKLVPWMVSQSNVVLLPVREPAPVYIQFKAIDYCHLKHRLMISYAWKRLAIQHKNSTF
jgi:hypothetical protein